MKHTIDITLKEDGGFQLDDIKGAGKGCTKIKDKLTAGLGLDVDEGSVKTTAEFNKVPEAQKLKQRSS